MRVAIGQRTGRSTKTRHPQDGGAELYPPIESSSCLPLFSSFITVSALLPTLAIAASISGFDFLKCLHQYRASSLLEMSTQFRALFMDEVVSILGDPCEILKSVQGSFCSPKLTKERGHSASVVGRGHESYNRVK